MASIPVVSTFLEPSSEPYGCVPSSAPSGAGRATPWQLLRLHRRRRANGMRTMGPHWRRFQGICKQFSAGAKLLGARRIISDPKVVDRGDGHAIPASARGALEELLNLCRPAPGRDSTVRSSTPPRRMTTARRSAHRVSSQGGLRTAPGPCHSGQSDCTYSAQAINKTWASCLAGQARQSLRARHTGGRT